MEYYITLTYSCNLKCAYCAAQKVVFHEDKDKKIQFDVLDRMIDFILLDYLKRKEQSYIVFYGGEPTLEVSLMEYILNKTKDTTLKYILYTNGLLLRTLSPSILDSLNIIFISIDGDKKVHDFYKFQGAYDQVIDNSLWLKQNSKAKTIARITLQEESDLFESVMNICEHFDYVFWQIVNKPYFKNAICFVDKYRINVKKLYDLWLAELKKNKFIKIIPFIALMSDFSLNTKNAFKCGMGVTQMDFDIFGNVYMCDEYLGEREHICGNVNDFDSISIEKKYNYEIYKKCIDCVVSNQCCGRCRHALEMFSEETINIYCEMTKIFIDIVRPIDINHLLTESDERVIEITEQIP